MIGPFMIGGLAAGEGIADHCRKTRALPSSIIPRPGGHCPGNGRAAPVNNRQNTGGRLCRVGRDTPNKRIPGAVAEHPIRRESIRRCMAASDIDRHPEIPTKSAETIMLMPPFGSEDVISGKEICQAKSDMICPETRPAPECPGGRSPILQIPRFDLGCSSAFLRRADASPRRHGEAMTRAAAADEQGQVAPGPEWSAPLD
jgi:hypothetical protein